MSDLEHDIDLLAGLLRASRRVAVFTGAGISAESGIPTYRGEGGTWTKWDPDIYASIDYFRRDPSYYWTFFKEVRHDLMASAQPGAGHLAIAALEKAGRSLGVITQNIDGLHRRAGSSLVIELHGNTTRFYCTACARGCDMTAVWEKIQTQLPPLCDDCKNVLRPDVVMFGEMLPPEAVDAAYRMAGECDLMLVVGSSLVVYPAADIPYRAKLNGAKLVILNVDPTPLDGIADLCLHCKAGAVLPQAVELADGMNLKDDGSPHPSANLDNH